MAKIALRGLRQMPWPDPHYSQVVLDSTCDIIKPDSCGCAPGDGLVVGETPIDELPGTLMPRLIVRGRDQTGWDDFGNPTFTWFDIIEGIAHMWTIREEVRPHEAGFTNVTAEARLLNAIGLDFLPETSVVHNISEQTFWKVKATSVTVDRIEMKLTRLAHDG
jgi:hypothetical protein